MRDAHLPRLYGFCLRLTAGCIDDAEDLTQETLLAAFSSLPRFVGKSSVRTWLYRIAVHRWRHLREKRGPATLPLALDGPAQPDGAAASVVRLSLLAALQSLPEAQREAFLLVKAEGLTHREAAAVLQVPLGTVQSRVHEATHRLRAALSDDPCPETTR
jgi:RNA polymerase sigma-70 factor (ECF subfamily)